MVHGQGRINKVSCIQDRKHLVPSLDSSHHGGKKQGSTFGCPGYPSQTVPSCKYNFLEMTSLYKSYQIIKLATITVPEKFTDKTWFQRISNWYVSFWHLSSTHWPMVVPAASMASFQRFRASPDSSYSSRSICAAAWRGICILATGKGTGCLFRLNNKSLELLANSGNQISTYINVYLDLHIPISSTKIHQKFQVPKMYVRLM